MARRSPWPIALLLGLALPLAACGEKPGEGPPASDADLFDEYVSLRTLRSLLEARGSLSRSDRSYLIVDLSGGELRLELQGVLLTTAPVARIRLNARARAALGDTTRFGLIEEPFVVEGEDWFEEVPTLASKDSAAVMSAPDTTGQLAARIRDAAILGLLRCDRELVIALDGRRRPGSIGDRVAGIADAIGRLLRQDPGGRALRRAGREGMLIRLRCDPAAVRALAPNLEAGTPVVLRF